MKFRFSLQTYMGTNILNFNFKIENKNKSQKIIFLSLSITSKKIKLKLTNTAKVIEFVELWAWDTLYIKHE